MGCGIHAPFRIEPEAVKVIENGVKSSPQVSFDVFENNKSCTRLSDDAPDVRPEVARVGLSETFAGIAEGLTGVTGSDEIHSATPRAAIEGAHIRPNRRWIQPPFFHARSQELEARSFPLHETHSASSKDHAGGKVQATDS